MRGYVSDTPIPEQNWKQAYDLAQQAAISVGATNLTVFKDAPNDHDVQFTSDTGTTLRFGSQAAALISGSIRLQAAAQIGVAHLPRRHVHIRQFFMCVFVNFARFLQIARQRPHCHQWT